MTVLQPILWSLLHSLWQGALIAGLVGVILKLCPPHYARTRYFVALSGLALVVFGAFFTWSLHYHPIVWTSQSGAVIQIKPEVAASEQVISSSIDGQKTAARLAVDWTLLLTLAWLCGVVLMLVRMAISLGRTSRLVALGTPVTLPDLDKLVAKLRLRCRLRVLMSPMYQVPAVVGTFSPIILVPTALLAEMSPEQLQMILAHELAHIRRWDFLVNLVQQVIEALLFFNPAVWWISSQIRHEREACCDAVASSLTGTPELLARTLVDVAARLTTPTPLSMAAMAAVGNGSLKGRILRLIAPTTRVPIGFPLRSLVLGLLVATVLLTVVASTAELTVRAAEKILSPAERVEKIATLEKQMHPDDIREDRGNLTVTGHVRTSDGRPLPSTQWYLTLLCSYNRSSTHLSADVKQDGSFTCQVNNRGRFMAWAVEDGFAPAFSEMVETGADGKVPPLEVVLSQGFTSKVQLINGVGKPVVKAVVSLDYEREDKINFLSCGKFVSDDDGVVTIPHAIDRAARVTIQATGYQFDQVPLRLSADKTEAIKLIAGRPTTGVIRDAVTGKPLAKATVKLISRKGFANTTIYPHDGFSQADILATTDEEGRFKVAELRDDCSYALCFSAEGHASQMLEGMKAGQENLEILLEAAHPVTLEILADEGKMPREVGVRNVLRIDDCQYDSQFNLKVKTENGIGRVVVMDPLPSRVIFQVADKVVKAQPGKDATVRMDLRAATAATKQGRVMREVVFQINVPKDAPAANGTLWLNNNQPEGVEYEGHEVKVVNGEGRIDLPVPSHLGLGSLKFVGYRVPDKSYTYEIPAGSEPYVIDFTAQSSGAIHGKVTGPDGKPWTAYFYAVALTIEKSPEVQEGEWRSMPDDNVNSGTASYLLTPMPLKGRYRVLLSAGAMHAISDEIKLDGAHPIAEVPLSFAPGLTFTGVVRDAAGAVVAGNDVTLEYNSPYGYSAGSSARTDREGRFVFEHVNSKLAGAYSLTVKPGVMTQGLLLRKLTLSEKPFEVKLKAGHVLKGTVVDAETKAPMANARVYATPADYSKYDALDYPNGIEAVTNSKGEFEFRNLEETTFSVRVMNAYMEGTVVRHNPDGSTSYQPHGDWPKAKADQAEGVELRVVPEKR